MAMEFIDLADDYENIEFINFEEEEKLIYKSKYE